MELRESCPICQGESIHERTVPNWGEMRRCTSCELIFANPMALPESPESLFDKAYKGVPEDATWETYGERVALRTERKKGKIDPGRTLFWGAYDQAIAWLRRTTPKGSAVLDIGCGVGYWISALREEGYKSVGLDVAKEVVDILTDEGFKMWHGTVESIEPNWQQPAVCSSFFVLHHIENPVGFLTTIRNKFPKANLLIGVWNQFPVPQQFTDASLPPRTLSWWGPRALKQAMEKAGYRVSFVSQPIGASEFKMPKIIQRIVPRNGRSKWYNMLFSTYYALKPIIFTPWKFWKRSTGKAATVLAIGEPC